MAENETLGASFSIDITNLKAGLAQANRMIRESESEFKAAAAGMDDWTDSQEGLTAKIKQLNKTTDLQKKKVNALQKEYDRLVKNGLDPSSKEATELRTKINNETAALNKNQAELKKNSAALEDLTKNAKKAGDATEDAGKSFEGLKKIGGVAAGAVAGVAAACVGAVGAFFGLAESTREARDNMAKLVTSFETAGHSAEVAEETFTNLYGILGDEGQATEAAQQLAKFSKDEEALAANTRILTGVMAEYGDSIPTEGLAEGMAASAAMGSVQGVLADALEWQGVNLDSFNEKLATMATEEERAAYIQETLTGLYGESADAYMKNNAAIIEANKAQAGLNEAMNELGAIAEPVMTMLKTLATDVLGSILPFVQMMGEGLTGALNGSETAADSLAEGITGMISVLLEKISSALPMVIQIVLSTIPKLLTAILGQLPTIFQTLLSCVSQIATALGGMLPTLIPVAINAVLMLAETLLDNIDTLIDAGLDLLLGLADGIVSAIPLLIEKAPVIIEKLVSAIVRNLPKILSTGNEIILKLASGIVKSVPQLLSKIPGIISSILKGFGELHKKIPEVGADLIRGLWDGVKDMTKWITDKLAGFGDSILGGIKSFFGIKSPSKVMADEVGKNLALGIGKGFEKNIGAVNDMITGAIQYASPRLNIKTHADDGGATPATGRGVIVYQTNNYSQAHSRLELYESKKATAAAVRLAMGAV